MYEFFNEIYNLYKTDVYRLAYSFTQNKADAEDITQKVFIKFYKNIKKINDKSKIKSWLLTVTSNECKNLVCNFWKKNIIITEEENLDITGDSKNYDNTLMLAHALKKLPKKYRICLHLFYYYGYSIKEISNIMKLNSETVKTRLSRGRNILRKEMKKYEN